MKRRGESANRLRAKVPHTPGSEAVVSGCGGGTGRRRRHPGQEVGSARSGTAKVSGTECHIAQDAGRLPPGVFLSCPARPVAGGLRHHMGPGQSPYGTYQAFVTFPPITSVGGTSIQTGPQPGCPPPHARLRESLVPDSPSSTGSVAPNPGMGPLTTATATPNSTSQDGTWFKLT